MFPVNLCQSRHHLRKNLRPSRTMNQYFVPIVAELSVMALSAKVYVLPIVTISISQRLHYLETDGQSIKYQRHGNSIPCVRPMRVVWISL